MDKPELIAPAGSWSALLSAVGAGADAVYFGVKDLNMRHGADNFDLLELGKVMDFLREKKKKGYLALNTFIYDDELAKVKKIFAHARENGVHAVIVWDSGLIAAAKEAGLKIHLSTQASVSNFEALKFYSSFGIERVTLARECTLQNIKDIISSINRENIDCGIETFIHGAMCASVSGRCFLSQDVFYESANRGRCLQPCRREFTIIDDQNECEYILGSDYILSAKDLCTITFFDQLVESGISAFKIEGRNRSSEYVKIATSCYREAIDAFYENKLDEELKEKLLCQLRQTFNRGFTSGFYLGKPRDLGGELRNEYEKIYAGRVVNFYSRINVAEVIISNESLKIGQELLVMGKKTPAGFTSVTEMEIGHKRVTSADRGQRVGLKLPFTARINDKVFIWQAKK